VTTVSCCISKSMSTKTSNFRLNGQPLSLLMLGLRASHAGHASERCSSVCLGDHASADFFALLHAQVRLFLEGTM
jgi:hypothetical protein